VSYQFTPVQQQIIDGGFLSAGFNAVLQLPTSSGKTYLAKSDIEQTLKKGGKVIYLTPLRAIAAELYPTWHRDFAPRKTGIFTGGENEPSKIPYQDADILIMTPEKLDLATRSWRRHWDWISQIDLIVVDELHLLGDQNRGASLEGTLLRMFYLNPFLRILGLSATLGNREELADWMRGVAFYSSDRPIPLEWKIVRFKAAQQKPELALSQVKAIAGQTLIFVQSRRRAESLAEFLAGAGIHAAYHHAGMMPEDRKLAEKQFRDRTTQALVATPTLEMGVNLPASQVIIYDTQTFNGYEFVPMTTNSIWQKAGRAGRPGLDATGHVVLIAPNWGKHEAEHYLKGKFEPIQSSLSSRVYLSAQVVAMVGSSIAKTPSALERVFALSLAAHQKTLPPIDAVISDLVEAGMLEQVEETPKLKATPLGFVAVRHLLLPRTVLLFKNALQFFEEEGEEPTFFDLLVVAIAAPDNDLIIRVDFEQLEELSAALLPVPSVFLGCDRPRLVSLLELDKKQLLSAIYTAFLATRWTRSPNPEAIAEQYGCYPFEIMQIADSLPRILDALADVTGIIAPQSRIQDKTKTLSLMIAHGINSEAVTLTGVEGIGALLALTLQRHGISDIEALATSEYADLVKIPGISKKRATSWPGRAVELVEEGYTAYRYREETPGRQNLTTAFQTGGIDPYRYRRSRELRVIASRDKSRYWVSGGTDEHTVIRHPDGWTCDCPDTERECKHILAIRAHENDPELAQLYKHSNTLDLIDLWMV
jgi:helicase